MPTYEYLCQDCSHRFETWQKMTDEPLTLCPACNGHIRRVLYPTNIVFKGRGFYKTSHGTATLPATNGETKNSEGSTEKASSTETASTTKSESKAASSVAAD